MKINSKYFAIALIVLINTVVFSNSLHGDFVYDDTRQIIRNTLIQDASLYGKALISDVWAFKGDGTVVASNYWRPTFTAFNILAFQTFGLNPVGWHLLNILLHIGVCVLAFLLLVRWGLSSAIAFAIALIFAVHPIHVESVSWIAGSPDLLFSLFILASIWFAANYSQKRNFIDFLLAIMFYGLALGSKEIAILCFPVYWLVFARESGTIRDEGSNHRTFKFVIPFAAIAILYFVARWLIIGQLSHPVEGAVGIREAILTVPSAFVFYLKQIFFPVSLGINYPIRPVLEFDFLSFVLPLIASVAFLILLLLKGSRSFVQKLGWFLFLMPLVPAMNLTAFTPEQLVHDRYLYFPLLGLLMVVLPAFETLAAKYSNEKSTKIVVFFAIIVCIPLSVKTFLQNRTWASDITLWENSTRIDNNSSHSWAQYGAALLGNGQFQKSVEAYDNSLDVKVSPLGLLGRALANLNLKRLEEAVRDLKTVTEMKNEDSNAYTLYQTYEALAIAYSEQRKPEDARSILIEARKRLPIYYAALTEKLAIIYYQMGKKDVALQELEAAKTQAKVELLPESKTVLLRLAMLYAERGEKDNAQDVLQEYLKLTSAFQDKLTLGDRKQAIDLLNQVK